MAEVVKNVAESLDKDLAILQPEETFVEVDGERIYVKPYTFGKLLKALKYLSNLAGLFAAAEGEVEPTILEAFAKHGDDVLGLLSLATDKDREFFDTLDAEKGLDLAILTYKVNESFFSNQLIPKIQNLLPSDLPEAPIVEETEKKEGETPKSKTKKAGSTSSKN